MLSMHVYSSSRVEIDAKPPTLSSLSPRPSAFAKRDGTRAHANKEGTDTPRPQRHCLKSQFKIHFVEGSWTKLSASDTYATSGLLRRGVCGNWCWLQGASGWFHFSKVLQHGNAPATGELVSQKEDLSW